MRKGNMKTKERKSLLKMVGGDVVLLSGDIIKPLHSATLESSSIIEFYIAQSCSNQVCPLQLKTSDRLLQQQPRKPSNVT